MVRNAPSTKTSWKNDAGTWESRTEWHRCIAFARLAEFAGSPANGAHVAIEDGAAKAARKPGVLRIDNHTVEARVGRQCDVVKWLLGTGLEMPAA